jgi:hypothetical protein
MLKQQTLFSGKFVLRLPPEVHRKLSKLARHRGISLNQICVEKLQSSYLEGSGAGGNQLAEVIATRLRGTGVSPLGVVLFGSTARGENRESSDIDLLIVLDSQVTLSRELYRSWDRCFPLISSDLSDLKEELPLSPQFVHLPLDPLSAGSLWYECAIDGLILMDADFQIAKFCSQIRQAILEGRIRRESVHGHTYWIKNAK